MTLGCSVQILLIVTRVSYTANCARFMQSLLLVQFQLKMKSKRVLLSCFKHARSPVYVHPKAGSLSEYYIVPESGSCAGRDKSARFSWDLSIRRLLRGSANKGYLGKALTPVPSRSKLYKNQKGHRWDLVVKIKGKTIKFARVISDWLDVDGEPIAPEDMEDYNIDHIQESRTGLPPRCYLATNLRPIHKDSDPSRVRKRPSAKRHMEENCVIARLCHNCLMVKTFR